MSAFEDYFDAIYVINRAGRRDRWLHVMEQCHKVSIFEYFYMFLLLHLNMIYNHLQIQNP